MKVFDNIVSSWKNFLKEVGYKGQGYFSVSEARDAITPVSTNKTTYDRYAPEHGLHSEPKEKHDEAESDQKTATTHLV